MVNEGRKIVNQVGILIQAERDIDDTVAFDKIKKESG